MIKFRLDVENSENSNKEVVSFIRKLQLNQLKKDFKDVKIIINKDKLDNVLWYDIEVSL